LIAHAIKHDRCIAAAMVDALNAQVTASAAIALAGNRKPAR